MTCSLGGDGNDYLLGGSGDDVLNGEGGNDLFLGQAGADIYQFDGSHGTDRIVIFTQGEDLIEFTEGVFDFGGISSRYRVPLGDPGIVVEGVLGSGLVTIALDYETAATVIWGSDNGLDFWLDYATDGCPAIPELP